MGKLAPDATYDALLDYIAGSNELIVCSAEPDTYAEATSTFALGDYAMTAGDGNGDFVVEDRPGGGRQLRVLSQSGGTGDTTGTGTHIALVQSSGTTLRWVTTCDSIAIESGVAFTTGTWRVILPDPE